MHLTLKWPKLVHFILQLQPITLQLWYCSCGRGSLNLFTADRVANKSTVAYSLQGCHGPAVKTATTIGSRGRPSRHRRRSTRSLCAATPFMELTGGDFGEKCNPTRWDRTRVGATPCFILTHVVQLSHRPGIEQSVRPSRSHNQRLALNLRVSVPGEKSRSTWCFRWVPAHLSAAPFSVSVLPSYLCYRKKRRKKERNCVTCVTAFCAPTILCTWRIMSLNGAALLIVCVQVETGKSLLGSKPLFFFLFLDLNAS